MSDMDLQVLAWILLIAGSVGIFWLAVTLVDQRVPFDPLLWVALGLAWVEWLARGRPEGEFWAWLREEERKRDEQGKQ